MKISNLAICAYISLVVSSSSGLEVELSNPSAFQSEPSITGHSFAGGLAHDETNKRLYVTGASYPPRSSSSTEDKSSDPPPSSCFLGALSTDTLTWVGDKATGTVNTVPDACNALAISSSNGVAYMVGSAQGQGGIYASSGSPSADAVQSGFVTGYSIDSVDQIGSNVGSTLVDGSYPVQYPVAVTTSGSDIYVASVTSTDTSERVDYDMENESNSKRPDLTSGGVKQYGSSFALMLEKFGTSQPDGTTPATTAFTSTWSQTYSTDDATGISPNVHVGGILLKENLLLVAGSTRGSGTAFGDNEGRRDEDGYISKFNLETGELADVVELSRSVVRIGDESDDIITNICDDPNDPNGFFVVGATKSGPNLIPTASKMRLDTLSPLWTEYLRVSRPDADDKTTENKTANGGTKPPPADKPAAGGKKPPMAVALDCHAIDDVLYIAGNVLNDGQLLGKDIQSSGSDDVFVAQLAIDDGSINWKKQIGSPERDTVAHGKAIAVDAATGNAIVYGSTRGSLFRSKGNEEKSSDLFAVTFNKVDGDHAKTMGRYRANKDGEEKGGEDDNETEPEADSMGFPAAAAALIKEDGGGIFGQQLTGPKYAGGLVYDSASNAILFTGAELTSDVSQCFFGRLSLNDGTIDLTPVGTAAVPEACSAITAQEADAGNKVYMVGGTENGGTLTDQYDPNSKRSVTQFGTVLQVETIGTVKSAVTGGVLLQSDAVTYPVAVTTYEEKSSALFVTSMISTSTTKTSDSTYISKADFPDLTSGGLRKYGSRFHLKIAKLASMDGGKTLLTGFERKYTPTDKSSIYPSGSVMVDGKLVVVGSTRGSGGVFGTGGADMDGFILKLNPTDGKPSTEGKRSNTRIDSPNQKDDWLTNICVDPKNPKEFYVVGATMGYDDLTKKKAIKGSIHPFIVKMNVDTLTPSWSKQIEAHPATADRKDPTDASAYGCAVDPNNELVYVAGVVKDDAIMYSPDDISVHFGKNDLFVAQVSTSDGTVQWVRQWGTPGNERLAVGGGIAVDSTGSAYVLGHTDGSLYRDRYDENVDDGSTEIVLFEVSKNGKFKKPVKPPLTKVTTKISDTEGMADSSSSSPAAEAAASSEVEGEKSFLWLWIMIYGVIGLIFITCICATVRRLQKRSKEKANQKRTLAIFKYLRAFDVDDIDIRRSPAGGYHGTYLNNLAFGKNKADSVVSSSTTGTQQRISVSPTRQRLLQQQKQSSSSSSSSSSKKVSPVGLTHATVADDYMFMSKRSLTGGGGGGTGGGGGAGGKSGDGEDTPLVLSGRV